MAAAGNAAGSARDGNCVHHPHQSAAAIEIFDEQIASLDTLTPLLQKCVQEGASSPAETLRAQVAADLFRAERERAKTRLALARRDLATVTGDSTPRFGSVVGRLTNIGQPPSFQSILRAI